MGRIPRQEIDHFALAHPEPEPPTEEVEIFGGITDEVPLLDDPGYLAKVQSYHLQLAHDQMALIAEAVEIIGDIPTDELDELQMLGVGKAKRPTCYATSYWPMMMTQLLLRNRHFTTRP